MALLEKKHHDKMPRAYVVYEPNLELVFGYKINPSPDGAFEKKT